MYSSNIFLFLCITLLLQRETFHWLLKMRDSDEELLVQATIKLNQLLFFFCFFIFFTSPFSRKSVTTSSLASVNLLFILANS